MTLIELTVVLLVLIGLAGLALPYVSGFISKTHNSTSADSGSALFTGLERYVVEDFGLPNNLNILQTGVAAAAPANTLDNAFAGTTIGGAIVASTPAVFATPYTWTAGNSNFNIVPSTANIQASLVKAGITLVSTLAANQTTPNADGTFTNTTGATFAPEVPNLAIGTVTNFVTDSGLGVNYVSGVAPYANGQNTSISGVLGYSVPTGHSLIVLGVGATNTAVGKTLASVPVHFGDKASLQPTYTYSRFLAAVDVDGTAANAAAKVVGIVHAPDTTDQWESLYSSIAGYYAS